jgi:hypothetical protein
LCHSRSPFATTVTVCGVTDGVAEGVADVACVAEALVEAVGVVVVEGMTPVVAHPDRISASVATPASTALRERCGETCGTYMRSAFFGDTATSVRHDRVRRCPAVDVRGWVVLS